MATQVTGKILGFEQDELNNIVINIEYTLLDDSKEINPYHAQLSNFEGKTLQEMEDFIQRQIDYQCERYVKLELEKKTPNAINDEINKVAVPYQQAYAQQVPSLNENIITNYLNSFVNNEYSKDKVVYLISDKGQFITEQLRPELASKYNLVKKIEISQGTGNKIIVNEINL